MSDATTDGEYGVDESDLLAMGGIRTRDIATGKTAKWSGEPEVVRLYDDGHRIYASWVSGGPVKPRPGQCVFVASYKQCDLPGLAEVVADALMAPRDAAKLAAADPASVAP